ncbi:hypothetical protein MRB53_033592 [Persea americana]|uniref:Uncharacterized protein n=1 Tax=Persea americana TaxID=3435 RepID=A0ACC2KV33_PERAE|nr:hypothetical protein MRB53_033592 [Persea americana]
MIRGGGGGWDPKTDTWRSKGSTRVGIIELPAGSHVAGRLGESGSRSGSCGRRQQPAFAFETNIIGLVSCEGRDHGDQLSSAVPGGSLLE